MNPHPHGQKSKTHFQFCHYPKSTWIFPLLSHPDVFCMVVLYIEIPVSFWIWYVTQLIKDDKNACLSFAHFKPFPWTSIYHRSSLLLMACLGTIWLSGLPLNVPMALVKIIRWLSIFREEFWSFWDICKGWFEHQNEAIQDLNEVPQSITSLLPKHIRVLQGSCLFKSNFFNRPVASSHKNLRETPSPIKKGRYGICDTTQDTWSDF